MSETFHLHDAEDNHIGNICRPGPLRYLPRVHRTGARRYEPLGKPTTLRAAVRRLGDAMVDDRHRWFNRGDVLALEKDSYYDPTVVFEVRR